MGKENSAKPVSEPIIPNTAAILTRLFGNSGSGTSSRIPSLSLLLLCLIQLSKAIDNDTVAPQPKTLDPGYINPFIDPGIPLILIFGVVPATILITFCCVCCRRRLAQQNEAPQLPNGPQVAPESHNDAQPPVVSPPTESAPNEDVKIEVQKENSMELSP